MLGLGTITTNDFITLLLLVFTVWIVCLYTYRITLHPLAEFPGPKLAAVTRWYEFYYDIILKGQYVFHLQRLHQQYGPIIRISPEELHINDPDFFDTLYTRSGRLHKYDRDSLRFGNPTSVFVTAHGDLHRVRRTALNPFFSKRNIAAFQHVVRDKVNQMVDKIATYRDTGKPLTISFAYMALAGDVVMEYCFGYNFDHLSSEGFATNFHELLITAAQSGSLAVHFPIVMTILMSMPEWFVVWSTPLFALLFKLQKSVEKDVERNRRIEDTSEHKYDSDRPNIIQFLMRSELPPAEKADSRLRDEAQNFVGAGASTTGWVLSVATFYIAQNPLILRKLRAELEKVMSDSKAPDYLELGQLEKCDYLTACIKEGIRLADPVSGRSIRLSDNVIQYGKWQIPPMTPVSMTVVDLFHNEEIFPGSRSFRPERWLGDGQIKREESLDKYFFGFSKGNRMCLGINLAWAELYMALAGVFRNFDLELFDTDESDVALKHDFMIPSPKLDSEGVRVLIK